VPGVDALAATIIVSPLATSMGAAAMPLPFLRRRSRDPTIPRRVTVYSRPGCHLCDDALVLLHGLQREWMLQIHEIDISGDPALKRRYGLRIPVIVVDGRIELQAPITERAIRKALR